MRSQHSLPSDLSTSSDPSDEVDHDGDFEPRGAYWGENGNIYEEPKSLTALL